MESLVRIGVAAAVDYHGVASLVKIQVGKAVASQVNGVLMDGEMMMMTGV